LKDHTEHSENQEYIQLYLGNKGTLSIRKKSAHFNFLTEEELAAMEQAVRNGYSRNNCLDTVCVVDVP